MLTIHIDDEPHNADWIKQTWDLPPYKSPEFMATHSDLDHFRTLPVYEFAVEKGIIVNDRWVGPIQNINTNEKMKTQLEQVILESLGRSNPTLGYRSPNN